MITLDATIVNVALPAIRASVGGDLASLQWVVDAYTVALAALLLSAGWIADRIGARRVFLVGLGVFVVASAACAAATDETVLVVTRTVQGIGAAGLLPASLAMIVHEFPDHAQRARALGVWGGMSGLGMAAGPVLGGLAVGLASWRLIFLVNVPIGLLALGLTRWAVSETPHRRHPGFDLAGQVLSMAGLALLVAGFIEAGQRGWTASVPLALFGSGTVLAAGFLWVEAREAHPMLPLGLFRRGQFRGGVAIGLLFNFCLYGTFFCLSLYLEQTLGLSALAAGLCLLPATAIIGVGAFTSGRLVARSGVRLPMLLGAGAGLLGSVLFATLGAQGSKVVFVLASIAFGCISLTMPAMTTLTMHSLPADQAGLGSGVLNAARQSGGALGVAVLGSLLGAGSHTLSGTVVLHPALGLAAVGFVGIGVIAAVITRPGNRAPDHVP